MLAARCDACNRTLTYTLYKDAQEKGKYLTTSGIKLDEHFNFEVDTSKGIQYQGFLTAEVPDLPDGCRIMNPKPVRLPFDIEVCGLEKIASKYIKPFNHGLVAGVTEDIKLTTEELLDIFNVTNTVYCKQIKEFKLLDFDSTEDMNANFAKSIVMKPVVNGTEDGLVIKNNVKVDTTFSFSL